MLYFLPNFDGLRLDVVGFLAILGESSITTTQQVCTLSWLCALPRLLPAPHAMLSCERPRELPSEPGKIIGIESGNVVDHIAFFPNILNNEYELKEHEVTCMKVTINSFAPRIRPQRMSLLPFIEITACLISCSLLVLACIKRDGWALVADLVLSFLSTIIGFTHKWRVIFEKYQPKSIVPPGDLVVYYPKGYFIIIKCDEDVARELYLSRNPSTANYLMPGDSFYRGLLQLGTIMLMIGVIALANATLILQTSFGAAYLLLNLVYWAASAGDQRRHWDMQRYNVTTVRLNVIDEKDKKNYIGGVFKETSFTGALWKAIAIAGDAHWVRAGQIAPQTAKWDAWLQQAQDKIAPHVEAHKEAQKELQKEVKNKITSSDKTLMPSYPSRKETSTLSTPSSYNGSSMPSTPSSTPSGRMRTVWSIPPWGEKGPGAALGKLLGDNSMPTYGRFVPEASSTTTE